MNQTKFKWIYCNRCGKETRHTIVAEIVRLGSEGDVEISRTSQMLECGGCEHTVLRKYVHISEYQEYRGDLDPDAQIFPPPFLYREPAWIASLENYTLKAVLQEVYLSLNVGLRFLAAVGVRTALDIVINEQIGDVGTFEQKLDRLVSGGFVSSEEHDRLEVLTEAGSAAAHRGYAPTPEVLAIVIKILESLVQKLYVEVKLATELSVAAEKIRPTIPRRNDGKKRTSR